MRYFKDKWEAGKLFRLDYEVVYFYNKFDHKWEESSYTPNEFLYISKQLSDGWFDLRSVSELPLGVLVGYKQTSLQLWDEITSGDLNTYFFRVGYNNPIDFNVAIEVSINKAPVDELDQTLTSYLAKIMLRYYFE